MTVLIEARGLSKHFGRISAVNALSLQVQAGEIYGLVGPDGAGKTTTLRLLCGALQAGGGAAFIGGIDVTRHPDSAREQIGYLPQRFSLYEELTVLENLRFFAEVRGLTAGNWRPRSLDILTFVGLDSFTNRRAGQLSGGMKQKLGLAAALVHRPHVLLLDEPTTGVDPVTRQDFWQLLIRLVVEEAVAVLVSTPYMDEAARCSRLGFMAGGRLWREGTPAALRQTMAGRVAELRGEPLALLRRVVSAESGVQDTHLFGDRIHLHLAFDQAESVLARLPTAIDAAGGTVTGLRLISPQLEDVFLALLKNPSAAEPQA